MEFIVFVMIAVALVVLMLAKGLYDEQRDRKKLIDRLKNHYGEMQEKEYRPEQYASISRYFFKHPAEGQIDDITWNDLNMDDVFKRMNDTFSSAGEEVLYYILRTPQFSEEKLAHFEELIQYFAEHTEERVGLQLLFHRMGHTGRFSLYDYLDHLDILGKRSNSRHWILNLLYIPCILLCAIRPSYGVLCLVLLMLYNMITYFKEKNEIDPYISSFAYVMRLMDVAQKTEGLHLDELQQEMELLRSHRKNLSKFKRGSFWLMSSGRMSGSGNPLDIILDYLRMICHLDLMKFNSMLEQVRLHTEDVDVLFSTLGSLEAAIAVGAYRKSLSEGYCIPQLMPDEKRTIAAREVYHPLIDKPVKNSIRADRGVLLTGSNASGKSTFLKTVAVNAIFAQTIHTVLADFYEGSYFHIYSSMALRDDLAGGESYYMVEIRAIKRILDVAGSGADVLCFVDEVLRGTNTVERISASTEILKSLSTDRVMCFAATHDVELTELLADIYDNYHFEEEIIDGDVHFNYRLLGGKATTRNAIKLLQVMGYQEAIIENANRRAEAFLQTGKWR
ncbi:MAG: hypothetical protein ACI4TB_11475 [Lachnospiraceae bacterium]